MDTYNNKDFYLDFSKSLFSKNLVDNYSEKFKSALNELKALEKGEKVNKDEDRMVGHYWLRNSEISPNKDISSSITEEIEKIKNFSKDKYTSCIWVGIGGSGLGPRLLHDAFSSSKSKIKFYFLDNTDPDGVELALESVEDLSKTLVAFVSKSGGTTEPKNCLAILKEIWKREGLSVSNSFISVSVLNSKLDTEARENNWLERFFLWDWVGGRTSIWSAVGLLPLYLYGANIDEFLKGASWMDEQTRSSDLVKNPAGLLASAWHDFSTEQGIKNMVILPYRDRLGLLGQYFQQLVMESIGKENDFDGNVVNEGISVFGNKGTTDQHSFVQQLREGPNDFFAIFIDILKNNSTGTKYSCGEIEVEPGIKASDYLTSFLIGTQLALYEKKRSSIYISFDEHKEFSLGAIIALFERAVSFYASYTNINAYNQPGVEAGKKAAGEVIVALKKLKNSDGEVIKADSLDSQTQNRLKRYIDLEKK